jgi:hypothetical protein
MTGMEESTVQVGFETIGCGRQAAADSGDRQFVVQVAISSGGTASPCAQTVSDAYPPVPFFYHATGPKRKMPGVPGQRPRSLDHIQTAGTRRTKARKGLVPAAQNSYVWSRQ